MTTHRTLAAEADFHESGWFDLGNGYEITKLPLIDAKRAMPDGTQLFARLQYRDAVTFAVSHGCELPTSDDLEALRLAGLHVEPVTIFPDSTDIAASINHDTRALAALRAAGWDGAKPVCGIGKWWIAPAPGPQKAALKGWWTINLAKYGPRHGEGWVQDPPGPHNDEMFDYGTLTMLKRRVVASTELPPDTEPSPSPANTDEVLGFLHRLPAFDVLAGSILGSLEEAFDDFLDWFSVDGMPVAREADPHPEVHDGPRCLPDKKTPTAAIDVFECLPDGDRRAKLILLAQWHLETAGGVSMHNYNIGNVKGRPGDAARCWQFFQCGEELTLAQFAALKDERVSVVRQYKRGNVDTVSVRIVPDHPGCCFRAFEQLRGGVLDYVALLRMPRYAQAYQRALAGDIAGFGLLLGQGGYYTAPVDGYTAELGRRLAILDRTLPASH